MANAGFWLTNGVGVENNVSRGMSLTSVAIGMVSDVACCYLGKWYFEGEIGLPKEKIEAKH